MSQLEDSLRRCAEDLDALQVQWALIGGLAVSARTEPRFTRDVDVAVAVADDQVAERLVRSLVDRGYRLVASVEQDRVGRLATVRLLTPEDVGSGVLADLLFASSGVETEVVRAAEKVEIVPGVALPVATTGHLLALKLLARDDQRRPQDSGDLRRLAAVAAAGDIALARETVRVISERGYDRGRDLERDLAALVER